MLLAVCTAALALSAPPIAPPSRPNGATWHPRSHLPVCTEKAAQPADVTSGLAFLAGVADVLCYSQHTCYANMMTGNTIWAASSLARLQWADAAFYTSLVATYLLGFAGYRAMGMRERGSGERLVAPAVLALFVLRDVTALLLPRARWHVLLLTFGFSLVNALSAEALGTVVRGGPEPAASCGLPHLPRS